MKTRTGLKVVVAAALLLGIARAGAAPYTAFMEGTTANYFDYHTLTNVPANDGLPFSLRVTFDVANGPLGVSSDPNYLYSSAGSERGCRQIVSGLCTQDLGGALPVVTDYSVITPFAPAGGFRPIPLSAYFYDSSARSNFSLSGIYDPLDIFAIARSQEQCIVTGNPESAYTQTCISTYFNIYLATTVNTMFGTVANLIDLNRTPNFADVPPGYAGFILVRLERTDQCTKEVDQEPVCEPLSYASGTSWLGEFSSLVILKNAPTSKDDCKGGGWKAFGFKNQGQCVKYVTHLK